MKPLRAFFLLLSFAIIAIPFGLYQLIRYQIVKRRGPPKPARPEDLARAEKKLGFSLPSDLRAFFMPPRPRCRVDCAETYTLGESISQYRMVTKSPYGPNGQDWPRQLFPFADLLPGYACYDLETGLVTEWDPEDLEGEDDDPTLWDRSFKKTGKTLSQWLSG